MDVSEYEQIPFAVKIVRDDDAEKIIAHEREFEILEYLHHPNVVRAVELFKDDLKGEIY